MKKFQVKVGTIFQIRSLILLLQFVTMQQTKHALFILDRQINYIGI